MVSDDEQVKMYTTQEVADLLGVSNRTIQLWATSGVLNAWKTPGGHRRFPQDEVHRLRQGMGGTGTSPENKTVLVLEDDPDAKLLYRININEWDLPLDLEIASDGYEGLLKIGLIRPAVIILDLQMPRIDGFRVLEVIENSEDLSDSLVMIVTALSEQEARGKYPIPKNIKVYSKPIPFQKLRENIARHLDRPVERAN